WEPLRKKRAETHRGSRRRNAGPLKEAGYTSAIVISRPEPARPLQSGGVHIHPHKIFWQGSGLRRMNLLA
ncbi:hypothetical protein, partial [Leisingera sp. F5]|uniref:hypothetical protein n=1 Tax=Leisingera sp. F5 TaxID=1813816 RepID=UPI0025BEF706